MSTWTLDLLHNLWVIFFFGIAALGVVYHVMDKAEEKKKNK